MVYRMVRDTTVSQGPLAMLSIVIALFNGMLGCSSVSSYYYYASLVPNFLVSSGGIINMLFVLATIPLATVGVATSCIELKGRTQNRTVGMLALAVNLLYIANLLLFSPALIAAGRV